MLYKGEGIGDIVSAFICDHIVHVHIQDVLPIKKMASSVCISVIQVTCGNIL